MSTEITLPDLKIIQKNVAYALAEDLGSGDVTANLIPTDHQSNATILCRESATLAGLPWLIETFKQVDENIIVELQYKDGDRIEPNSEICSLTGPTRSILSAERTALNFLQTLSGTATIVQQYVQAITDTNVNLLDTRKTIPGLRDAQKYAIRCGGGMNHRHGLYDAFLIKENHIMAAGNISIAIKQARQQHPNLLLEVEVENLEELEEALKAKPDRILLDNFTVETLQQAVNDTQQQVELEASGNITLNNIHSIAETGIDYISLGALTKNVKAIDLSLLLTSA